MKLLARSGAEEGLWLRADAQTGGKGRRGRKWTSPHGNLYASTLVRLGPGDPPPATLAMVVSIALYDVAKSYLPGGDFALKWPNDLMLGGAKVSGILLEREAEAVVIGVGLNLASHPTGLDRPVTSFAAHNTIVPPALLLYDLAPCFADHLATWRGEGLKPVVVNWQKRAHPVGTPLAFHDGKGAVIEGLFDGLVDNGALKLRLADGSVRVIHAGDVFLV